MSEETSGDPPGDKDSAAPKKTAEILDGIESRIVQKTSMTPEQGCLGCSLGIGLLIVTFIIWVCVYWHYNPEFHAHPAPLPAFLDPSPTPRVRHVLH